MCGCRGPLKPTQTRQASCKNFEGRNVSSYTQTLEKKNGRIKWNWLKNEAAPLVWSSPSNNTCPPPRMGAPCTNKRRAYVKSWCSPLTVNQVTALSRPSSRVQREKSWTRRENGWGAIAIIIRRQNKKEDSFWLFHPFHQLELTVAPNRRRSSVCGFAFPKTMMSHGKMKKEKKTKYGADLNRFAGGRQFVIFPLRPNL